MTLKTLDVTSHKTDSGHNAHMHVITYSSMYSYIVSITVGYILLQRYGSAFVSILPVHCTVFSRFVKYLCDQLL